MSTIYDRLKLIREGEMFESIDSNSLDGYDALNFSLSPAHIDQAEVFDAMYEFTNMADETAKILAESSNGLAALVTYLKNTIKYLKEKVSKFFIWIKNRFTLFRKQVKSKLDLTNIKKYILAYKGNRTTYIPERLFTVDINTKDIWGTIEDCLSEIDQVEQRSKTDSELSRYAGLMMYKDNAHDLSIKMRNTIVSDTFKIHDSVIEDKQTLLDAVYGKMGQVNLGTIRPELVVDKLTAYDEIIESMNKIGDMVMQRLVKFNNTYDIKDVDYAELSLGLRLVSALIEGVLTGVHKIHSVVIFGYTETIRVASVMAHDGAKQSPPM